MMVFLFIMRACGKLSKMVAMLFASLDRTGIIMADDISAPSIRDSNGKPP